MNLLKKWILLIKSSILSAIRSKLSPDHKISISWVLWHKLLRDLRERGLNQTRESGAFLLGSTVSHMTHISEYVLYDDLDPNCLDSGIVRFDGSYFGTLWDICREKKMKVVADVHVHPGGAQQSSLDIDNPMISLKGHIALIIPNFAQLPVKIKKVGIYEYLGNKKWKTIPNKIKSRYLFVGF